MPLLRIENLTKSFGQLEVLHETNLDVRDQETVVIIGASGSGKTTLLRCVNHLEWPTTGGIYPASRGLRCRTTMSRCSAGTSGSSSSASTCFPT